jgi:chromosomal replication initiation ATPase DnaA
MLNTRTAAPAAQRYATNTEPSRQFPLSPDPDDTLDHLISALRTHPNEQVRALAKTTRSEVRRIHQVQRRQLAAQQRALTIKRLELITAQVACALRVDPAQLTSRARQQHIAFCRQVAMYVGKTLTAASFPMLGASFGRDHSTAMAACAAIEQRMADETHGPRFRRFIEQLQAQIGGTATTAAAA